MATTALPDFEAATERLAAAGRAITGAYLDGIEKYVQTTQDLTQASVRFARELIAA